MTSTALTPVLSLSLDALDLGPEITLLGPGRGGGRRGGSGGLGMDASTWSSSDFLSGCRAERRFGGTCAWR